jgi:hypothetical protein
MELTDPVKRTLGNYERDNPGTQHLELAAAKPVYARAARPRIPTASLPKCARSGTAAANGSIIRRNTKAKTDTGCHCERSEAIPKGTALPDRDCFVAPLLAVT